MMHLRFLVGLSALILASCACCPMHKHHAAAGETAPAVAGASYTCPMHPNVVQAAPGKCPTCGMDLVAKK